MKKKNKPREYEVRVFKIIKTQTRITSQAANMIAAEWRVKLKGREDLKVEVAGIFT